MNIQNENINKLKSNNPSKWKEAAEFRIKNKWLEWSSQIARRILAAIEDNEELNQVKLAQAINVSPQQISKIVKGKENLTLETIFKLSEALQTDLISFPPYKWSSINNYEIQFSANVSVQINILVVTNNVIPLNDVEGFLLTSQNISFEANNYNLTLSHGR